MDRSRESRPRGGLGAAVILQETGPLPDWEAAVPSPCQWPTLALTGLAPRDVDAALAADPFFHRCPDGHRGRIEVRYWYFHPPYFSCWHCGSRAVEPEAALCRHQKTHRTGSSVRES